MRAMIVAAGLGTRMQPLTHLRPKPAVPVRGIPLIAYQLELLAAHDVTEVIINAHHLPEVLIEAARNHCPPGMRIEFSIEETLLDTGGGIRRAAEFLRESDPCLIIGSDMLLDADLKALCHTHTERGDAVTLLLRHDPRSERFGSVGIAEDGRVRRIGSRFDLGGESDAGLYVWANVVAARAFDSLPSREKFSHFDHWLAPLLQAGAQDIRAEVMDVTHGAWEPVGTLQEYLSVNLAPPALRYMDADRRARAQGVELTEDVVIGAGAMIAPGASVQRAVIWEGEQVPAGIQASDGVFAGGEFHSCVAPVRGA